MNTEQKQALKDKLYDLRLEKDELNAQIDNLVNEKESLVGRRTEINELIVVLKEGIES